MNTRNCSVKTLDYKYSLTFPTQSTISDQFAIIATYINWSSAPYAFTVPVQLFSRPFNSLPDGQLPSQSFPQQLFTSNLHVQLSTTSVEQVPTSMTFQYDSQTYTVTTAPLPIIPHHVSSPPSLSLTNSGGEFTTTLGLGLLPLGHDPSVYHDIDAFFQLRQPNSMGEVFHRDYPVPICTLQPALAENQNNLTLNPHTVVPAGFDVHAFGNFIHITGKLLQGDVYNLRCVLKFSEGFKTISRSDWNLTLYPSPSARPVKSTITAVYHADWKQITSSLAKWALSIRTSTFSPSQYQSVVSTAVKHLSSQFKNLNGDNPFSELQETELAPLRYLGFNVPLGRQISSRGNVLLQLFGESASPPNLDPMYFPSYSILLLLPERFNVRTEAQMQPSDPSQTTFTVPGVSDSLTIGFSAGTFQRLEEISSLSPFDDSILTRGTAEVHSAAGAWSGATCFSSFSCTLGFSFDLSSSALQEVPTMMPLCYQNTCQLPQFIPTPAQSRLLHYIQSPFRMKQSTFSVALLYRDQPLSDTVVLPGKHQIAFGYDQEFTKPTYRITELSEISVRSLIQSQYLDIDSDNSEFDTLPGKQYSIAFISFPTTKSGEIISPDIFTTHRIFEHVFERSGQVSVYNISGTTIPAVGSSHACFRIIYPDVDNITPSGKLYLDSASFVSVAGCMTSDNGVDFTDNCPVNSHCTAKGTCKCNAGFSGTNCELLPGHCTPPIVNKFELTPLQSSSDTSCGSHGTCTPATATCSCDSGWTGTYCRMKQECVNLGRDVCSNNGHFLTDPVAETCSNGVCECDAFWTGLSCNRCGLECKNGGRSYKSCTSCGCPAGFSGSTCQCSQKLGTFTIAMTNTFVEFVTKLRQDYASSQSIPSASASSIDISLLDLSADGIEAYQSMLDDLAQDAFATIGFASATSTVSLNLESTPPSTPQAYIKTKFSYTFTYNCDPMDQIDLVSAWADLLSSLPTKTLSKYFTSTLPGTTPPIAQESSLEDSPATLTDDDTNEENSSLLLSTTIAFIIVFLDIVWISY